MYRPALGSLPPLLSEVGIPTSNTHATGAALRISRPFSSKDRQDNNLTSSSHPGWLDVRPEPCHKASGLDLVTDLSQGPLSGLLLQTLEMK